MYFYLQYNNSLLCAHHMHTSSSLSPIQKTAIHTEFKRNFGLICNRSFRSNSDFRNNLNSKKSNRSFVSSSTFLCAFGIKKTRNFG